MKKVISRFKKNQKKIIGNLAKKIEFRNSFREFERLTDRDTRFNLDWKERYPCLEDQTKKTSFDAHYIYHTAWAARILAITKPDEHVDISSALYFSAIVSAFIPVKFFDYRPAKISLGNLSTSQCDLHSLFFEDNSISSLSCMHVVEHIGLGRYGDPLDPQGDLKAMHEIRRVLAKKGDLLLVVPVGKPKVRFNAHRIYHTEQVLSAIDLKLVNFSLVLDSGEFIYGADIGQANEQEYGCGCFHLKK